MEFVLPAVAWRRQHFMQKHRKWTARLPLSAGCFLIAQAGLFICCTKTARLFWGIMILLKFHVPSRDFFLQSFANFDCLWNTIYTLRTEPPSIFLAKSGRGRNPCRHPRQFILSMLQIRIFLRRLSNRYRSIHCVCQLFVSKCKCWRERTSSFSPFRICVSSGFGSSIGTFSSLESKLATFQYKEVKKKSLELR